jgi:ferredoxin
LKEGKSSLKGAKKVGLNFELEVKEIGCNKDAAEVCPVNCIHIVDMTTGKKII